MPRPPKPADPFLLAAETAGGIPAIGAGHNSGEDPELIAARIVKSVEYIELQIAALNSQKSALFAQGALLGFGKVYIKDKIRDRATDQAIAAEKRRVSQIYSTAIDSGFAKLAKIEAEEKAAREKAAPAQPSLAAPALPPADAAFDVVSLGEVA